MRNRASFLGRWYRDLRHVYNGLCSERAKIVFKYSMLGAILFGMAANAFAYFNFAPMHDAVNYVDHLAGGWEISLGRFLQPIYGRIRGEFLTPWLNGMLSMFYIGLASFLVNDLFDIEKPWMSMLTAGFLSANATVTSQLMMFSYISDVLALALLLASMGAYFVIRIPNFTGSVFASIAFAASMGLYQSNVVFGGLLLVLYTMIEAICEKHLLQKQWKNWIRYAGTVLLTALIYFGMYRYFTWSYGVNMASASSYNSPARLTTLDWRETLSSVCEAYDSFFEYFFGIGEKETNLIQRGTAALFILTTVMLVIRTFRKKLPVFNCVMILGGAMLFPGIAQAVSILVRGDRIYFLTTHALFLMYPFAIGILNKAGLKSECVIGCTHIKERLFRGIIYLICGIILFGNIRFSNEMYSFRTVQYDKTVSYVTRLMERIDSVPGYKRNETEVVFSGYLSAKLNNLEEPDGSQWIGGISGTAITYLQGLRSFIHMMGEKMNIPLDYSEFPDYGEMEEVRAMPEFPDPGCCKMIDGRVLVKLPSN